MKLATRMVDKIDIARDEFRESAEKYNAAVRSYNVIISLAHDRVADAYFDILEPALKKLSDAAKEASNTNFDDWSIFAASISNEDMPRVPFPAEPVAAALAGDDIASEFENLPTE